MGLSGLGTRLRLSSSRTSRERKGAYYGLIALMFAVAFIEENLQMDLGRDRSRS